MHNHSLTGRVLIWVLVAFLKDPFVPEFTGKFWHMNKEPHLFTWETGCAKWKPIIHIFLKAFKVVRLRCVTPVRQQVFELFSLLQAHLQCLHLTRINAIRWVTCWAWLQVNNIVWLCFVTLSAGSDGPHLLSGPLPALCPSILHQN